MNIKEMSKITLNLVVIYAIGGVLLAAVYAYTSPIIYKNKKEDKERALRRMLPVHLMVNAPSADSSGVNEVADSVVSAGIGNIVSENTDNGLKLDLVVTDKVESTIKKLKKAGATDVTETSDNTPMKVGDWAPWGKHAEFYDVKKGDDIQSYIVETFGKGYGSYPDIYVAITPDLKVAKLNVLSHGETPGLGDEIMQDWFQKQYIGKGLDKLEVIKGETTDKIQAITGATISSRAVTNAVRDAIKMLEEKYEGAEINDYTWGGPSGLAMAGETAGKEGGNEH